MKKLVLVFLLVAVCSPAQVIIARKRAAASVTPPAAGISYVGGCSAATTSCTLPTTQAGDLILVFAGRDGSTTAPTNGSSPVAYTSVMTASINGTSTADSVVRLSCRIAAGAESMSTFANATSIVGLVYRNTRQISTGTCATDVLGWVSGQNFTSTINTTPTNVTYQAVTNGDSSSWDAGFIYTPAATAGTDTAPSDMTFRYLAGTTKAAGFDTNGASASLTAKTLTGSISPGSRVITTRVEIKAPIAATPTLTPSSGTPPQTVTLASTTTGADAYIHYTTDGSDPTSGSTTGTSVSVSSDPTTVKAKVIGMPQWTDSAIGSATYTGAAAPVNIGNTSGTAGSDSTGNSGVIYGLAVTTGSNAAGYSVTSATIKTGTFAGTAHYQFGIYDSSNLNTVVCHNSSTTQVLASASTVTDTQIATDCSAVTLAASHTYYIAINNDLPAAAYQTYTAGTQVTYDGQAFNSWNGVTWSTTTEYPQMYLTVTPK